VLAVFVVSMISFHKSQSLLNKMSLYTLCIKPIFFRFNPEKVHDFFTTTGEFLGNHKISRDLVDLVYNYKSDDKSKTIDGIYYRTPILLSAGFDYNAHLTRILPHIGLGGVEVGSVTARASDGNPSPQLQRLPKSKGVVVNKGLKNEGVNKIIERLKNTKREKDFVIGVSIARTNDQKSATTEEGIEDYAYSFKRLNEENIGDYYTLNISCPNVFGGESFANPNLLEQLLDRLEKIECKKPTYIKMPVNLPWEEFKKVVDVAIDKRVNGLVIGNLNKDYSLIDHQEEAPKEYIGGISGKSCFELSNNLIRKTREHYGKRFTIFGVGGVMSPRDAKAKFEAGADLTQLITGLIFEGPGIVGRILREIPQ